MFACPLLEQTVCRQGSRRKERGSKEGKYKNLQQEERHAAKLEQNNLVVKNYRCRMI
jgi:hypothetical protein